MPLHSACIVQEQSTHFALTEILMTIQPYFDLFQLLALSQVVVGLNFSQSKEWMMLQTQRPTNCVFLDREIITRFVHDARGPLSA